jgi:hypothetical protein
MVRTTVHTPRLKGLLFNAGDFDLLLGALRPFRTSWFTVGILFSCCIFLAFRGGAAAKQATKNPVAHPHGGVQIGLLVTNLSSPNSKPPNGSSETQRPDDTKYTSRRMYESIPHLQLVDSNPVKHKIKSLFVMQW